MFTVAGIQNKVHVSFSVELYPSRNAWIARSYNHNVVIHLCYQSPFWELISHPRDGQKGAIINSVVKMFDIC